MVRKAPKLLASDVENTFLPKLEFFYSKGFSSPDLAKFLSYNPSILLRSLKGQIIPFCNTFSNLIHSDEKTIKAIKKYPFLITYDIDVINGLLLSNFNILRDHGVPETNIIKAFYQFPRAMLINPVSEDKIIANMDFLLNKMSVAPSLVVNQPSVLTRSFQRTIVPRGLFAQHLLSKVELIARSMCIFQLQDQLDRDLLSKGLVKNFPFSALIDTSEKVFVKRFVYNANKAPELLKLYKDKVDFAAGGKIRKLHFIDHADVETSTQSFLLKTPYEMPGYLQLFDYKLPPPSSFVYSSEGLSALA
ncbi:hypothetical protein REPUB_Repub20aG0123100 [Reevesia pubescens]